LIFWVVLTPYRDSFVENVSLQAAGIKRKRLTDPTTTLTEGTEVEVYWPDDGKYYRGTIMNNCTVWDLAKINYDDGENEKLVMNDQQWRFRTRTVCTLLPEYSLIECDDCNALPCQLTIYR